VQYTEKVYSKGKKAKKNSKNETISSGLRERSLTVWWRITCVFLSNLLHTDGLREEITPLYITFTVFIDKEVPAFQALGSKREQATDLRLLAMFPYAVQVPRARQDADNSRIKDFTICILHQILLETYTTWTDHVALRIPWEIYIRDVWQLSYFMELNWRAASSQSLSRDKNLRAG
jgi:hypothetical protein